MNLPYCLTHHLYVSDSQCGLFTPSSQLRACSPSHPGHQGLYVTSAWPHAGHNSRSLLIFALNLLLLPPQPRPSNLSALSVQSASAFVPPLDPHCCNSSSGSFILSFKPGFLFHISFRGSGGGHEIVRVSRAGSWAGAWMRWKLPALPHFSLSPQGQLRTNCYPSTSLHVS